MAASSRIVTALVWCSAAISAATGLSAMVGAAGTAEGVQPGGQMAQADDVTIQTALLQHPARDLYEQFCAGCHGLNLEGGSANGFLTADDWYYGSHPDTVYASIADGIIEGGMPEFGSAFTEEQIGQLVSYVTTAVGSGEAVANRFGIPDIIETRRYDLRAEVVVGDDLETPWGIEFIDADTALITEKSGRLRWFRNGRLEPQPIEGTPKVADRGQGGLMEVAIDPEWDAGEDWVYLGFTHGPEGNRGPAMTKIVRGKIVDNEWTEEQTLFEADRDDYVRSGLHHGCRIDFDADGRLYFVIGDRGQSSQAQDLTTPNGNVFRINRDGTVPSDNPFADRGGGVYPQIWSYGHRNQQGLVFDPVT
ncbi:MAG: PQQ-dependent sugar dehydrogenase, partial [Planctomycetota bacterium]